MLGRFYDTLKEKVNGCDRLYISFDGMKRNSCKAQTKMAKMAVWNKTNAPGYIQERIIYRVFLSDLLRTDTCSYYLHTMALLIRESATVVIVQSVHHNKSFMSESELAISIIKILQHLSYS